jgi:hypothetical protein
MKLLMEMLAMADMKASGEFLDQYATAINTVIEAVSGAVVRVQRQQGEVPAW